MTSSGAIRCSSAEWEGRNIPFFTAQMAGNSLRQVSTLGRRQDPSRGVGVEQAEGDVCPLGDVAEHLSHSLEGPGLEVRWDEETDVGTGGGRMLGQLDGLEDVRAGRAGLDQRPGLDGSSRVDGDLQEPLALLGAQRPALADKATDPNPIVVQRPDAMGDQAPQCLLVHTLAAWTAERGVEGVDDAPKRVGSPFTSICCAGHG